MDGGEDLSISVKTLGSPPTFSRVSNAPTWHSVTGGSSTFRPPHESREGNIPPETKPLETRISNILLSTSERGGGDIDDEDGPEAMLAVARLGPHGRGNSSPLANLPLSVFPERCDAPPELPRATAHMGCSNASSERGNSGPLANLPFPDFPERCDAPPGSRRASADMVCDDSSF